MPLDGFTLGYIARELSEALEGARIDRVLQPEKDELQLVMRSPGRTCRLLLSASPHHARIHLTREVKQNPQEPPMFCMLLRKHLIGARFRGIEQVSGDRILNLSFDNIDELGDETTFQLIVEIMGKHSNIILTDARGVIVDSIRRVPLDLSRVREVLPGLDYELPPGQDKLPSPPDPTALITAHSQAPETLLEKALAARVSGLSSVTADEIAHLVGERATPESLARAAELLANPPAPAPVVLYREDGSPCDFFPFAYASRDIGMQKPFPTLSEAAEAYYSGRDHQERMKQKTASLGKTLKTALDRTEKKLSLQLEAIEDAKNADAYRRSGELITAAAPSLTKGAKRAVVPDYFSQADDGTIPEITIALDETLAPMDNAKRYFRLYRKARSAADMAAQQAEKSRADAAYLEQQLQSLSTCDSEQEIDEIRRELEREGWLRASHNRGKGKKLPPPTKPAAYVSSDGFRIYAGKNGAQNDALTQSADGDDLWLHAKDMPGSHIIVKCAGQTLPNATREEAAVIAALYSKGKSSGLVPVDMTPRKYVKKPGGAKPGFVIYTHQTTVYVTPDEARAAALSDRKQRD